MVFFPHWNNYVFKPCCLTKIRFPAFNHNMVVNEYLALVVNFMSLCYDIIFGANFLDKCGITLDSDNNLVHWMEYNIPLCNATEFFHAITTPLSSHWLRPSLKIISLAVPLQTPLQPASSMQNMNKSTSMMLPSTNITFCLTSNKKSSMYYQNTKNYLMTPVESILIRRLI